MFSSAGYDIHHRVALIAGCRDIQKHHFVGTFGVVTRCQFDWVAGVAQPDKVDTFHYSPRGHIKARNHARHREAARVIVTTTDVCRVHACNAFKASRVVKRPSYKALPTMTPARLRTSRN